MILVSDWHPRQLSLPPILIISGFKASCVILYKSPPPKKNMVIVAFLIGSLSVQSVVNRILCLEPLCIVQCHSSLWLRPVGSHRPDSTLLLGPIHFKLNQVIETLVTSSIPISLSHIRRESGLSHHYQRLCRRWESIP